MDFLITYWHCILPLAGIGIYFFLKNRDKKKKDDSVEYEVISTEGER